MGAAARLREAFAGLAVDIGGPFADVIVPARGNEGGEQGETELEESGEESAFDLVDAQPVVRSLRGKGDQSVELLRDLEESFFTRHPTPKPVSERSSAG